MMDIFAQHITPETLEAQTGSLAQVAGIRQIRLEDGPQKGGRLVQIRNASGLCVELLPDRCLDIGQVWRHGVPYAWMGPWGLPTKGAGINMDNALGGLMATCGFDHIRQPIIQDGYSYPLHGSMALTPCETLNIHPAPSPGGNFIVEATTRARAPDQAEYTLIRRITIPFDRNEIGLEDHITTRPASQVFALYHINLGFPLIGADTSLTLNTTSFDERLNLVPHVQIAPVPAQRYSVSVSNYKFRAALDILCDGTQLPWLQTYRRAEERMNLFCIEPTTHDRKPRAELLENSAKITPFEQKFALQFVFRHLTSELCC